jgi:hypothetical protein
LAKRLEKGVVGGYYGVEGFFGEPLAALSEVHAHGSPVAGIERSSDESGTFETVEARGHGPRGNQRGLGQVAGVGALLVTTAPQGVQDVEVAEAQSEGPEGSDDGSLEVGGTQQQAPGHLQRSGVHTGIALSPRLDDAVNGVIRHAPKRIACRLLS